MNKLFCDLCNQKLDRERGRCKFVSAKVVLCSECYKALNFVNIYQDSAKTQIQKNFFKFLRFCS